ncbi:MAG: hypothetical protein ACKN9W_20495, partial [Methylococcus sp.]
VNPEEKGGRDPGLWLTATSVRLEWPGFGFHWLSGVEANGTPVASQFASTPLSERLMGSP